MPDLATLQRWMQAVIVHPDGVDEGIASAAAIEQIAVQPRDIETVVTRSSNLSAVERLGIYANAYYARLLECLAEEFPALRRALGEDAFSGFAFGYLQTYPSTSYTLNDLSANFPQYLAETRPPRDGDAPDWADFAVDLARLERIYSDVFDGPGSEGEPLLDADDLLSVPPERWGEARLKCVPCLRVERFDFPVHEYSTAIRHTDDEPPTPAPARTLLAISRIDYVVRRWPLTNEQFVLLAAILEGRSLGEAIAAIVDAATDMQQLSERLRGWFTEWTTARFFHSVSRELPVA